MTREPICYSQVGTFQWVQEVYETSSKDAGLRARALRKEGFKVVVSPMGTQITGAGPINMTMLTIMDTGVYSLPDVKIVRL